MYHPVMSYWLRCWTFMHQSCPTVTNLRWWWH